MKRSLLLTLLLVATATACRSTTGEAAVPDIVGSWGYGGRRTSGSSGVVTYTGRLEFRRQQGMAFDGNFSADARDAQGTARLVTGFIAGSFISAEGMDFDVEAGGETLRHVGRLRNDSIVGSWLSSDGSQGSFVAVRNR